MLTVDNVTVRYDRHTVVENLSFRLEKGQWLMLIGPNGAGKSSLIHAIAQGVPYTGRIAVEGRDVRACKPAQLAKRIGVLSQQHSVGYAYTVEEVVTLGRYAYSAGFLSGRDDEGPAKVEQALDITGMRGLRHASMLTLSGGEIQRAFLAQVFAQDPSILILDEPANHLDLVYQKHIFSLIRDWLKQPGRAVLSVVHDLSLARSYGTRALLLGADGPVAQGGIAQALSRENLRRAYGMDVRGWLDDLAEAWNA